MKDLILTSVAAILVMAALVGAVFAAQSLTSDGPVVCAGAIGYTEQPVRCMERAR